MGDFCDVRDVERFVESKAGQKTTEQMEERICGRIVARVELAAAPIGVLLALHLDDGTVLSFASLDLTIDEIRVRYPEVLDAAHRQEHGSSRQWKGGQNGNYNGQVQPGATTEHARGD